MNVTVWVSHAGGVSSYTMEEKMPLKELLRAERLLEFPCGIGKCGKCLIRAKTSPTEDERRLLGQAGIERGLRLACHTVAADGLEITIPSREELKVLTSFTRSAFELVPVAGKRPIEFFPPALEDQRPDLQRLLEASGAARHSLSLERLAALPAFMRGNGPHFALIQGKTLLDFSATPDLHALVVDIGTTTVAALLVDLRDGSVLAARGAKNSQAPFGADVISRMEQAADPEPLRRAIVEQINALLAELLQTRDLKDVSLLVFAGNSTMLHLFCGLPPQHMGQAPFIPVSLESMRLPAGALGLYSLGTTYLLPGISAYIGADIMASLLAAGAQHASEPFLLADLGTNAETVLHMGGVFYACSAAAGPCFEGATLSCGMAGQNGAIDSVFLAGENLICTTIGNAPARGICGSGVLDVVALLLEDGALQSSGRLSPCGTPLGRRVAENEGLHVRLAKDVRLTQKDIREIQLAKAAVRAGVETLLQEAGIAAGDVARLYLAGGFGSALNPASAMRLGLFPPELAGKITVLGNAASFGALRYIAEKDALRAAASIIQRTRYIELSARVDFMERYVEQMVFPQE